MILTATQQNILICILSIGLGMLLLQQLYPVLPSEEKVSQHMHVMLLSSGMSGMYAANCLLFLGACCWKLFEAFFGVILDALTTLMDPQEYVLHIKTLVFMIGCCCSIGVCRLFYQHSLKKKIE